MIDAVERLVNLALLVAATREPVTAEQVRSQVAGYPPDQDEAAFLRMFERDKENLRAAGLAIAVDTSEGTEAYRLDKPGTFAGALTLSTDEALLVRVAGTAMLADPSFPYAADLRTALAKVAAATGAAAAPGLLSALPVAALLADEDPEGQAGAVAELTRAQAARKHVTFRYTNVSGASRERSVDPFGMFVRDGRWYLVGRDHDADDIRVFALVRVEGLAVSAAKPKSPDFELPDGFDVGAWMQLPFQYGDAGFEALLRLSGPAAARAATLTQGRGTVEPHGDGSVTWRMTVADAVALGRWVIGNGPGIELLEPPEARTALAIGLASAVDAHA